MSCTLEMASSSSSSGPLPSAPEEDASAEIGPDEDAARASRPVLPCLDDEARAAVGGGVGSPRDRASLRRSALRSFAYISEALARAAGNPLPLSD